MSALLFWSRFDGGVPLYSPYSSADIARGAQAVNRSSVAALTFLVWDVLITMDDEACSNESLVKLIWPRSWTYTKYVYFLARYLPIMTQISILFIGTELSAYFHFTTHDCYIWQIYQGVAASVIVGAVDTILILRVHALYHGNQIIRRVVAVFYAMEIIGMAIGLALALPGVTYDNLCLVLSVPHSLIIYGGATIVFQFFLFSLTLYKFIEAARSGWGDVPLIVLLMRDGTWAFFLLFFIYVGQLSLYALPNTSYAGVLYGWLLTIFSFCGYRILHNINRLADRVSGPENHMSNTRPTDTNIQFSTQIFNTERQLTSYAPDESFPLSQISRGESSQFGKKTYASTQISTLSLGS
ncbi:hypothetical protein JR316_0002004 [Psilocybe cubensis]|uniref:Uncharacterized protein n=2 Tax=Psilocybe cubensis TaxID=181762 RepID=A0ACB8HBQ7_PSICU|nr:hypothetical protein JR316_0002004 [Psilocybe cubensis]KAH9485097.1 hypothetical protein JR316_0002004 [Psilocybe cubensis]